MSKRRGDVVFLDDFMDEVGVDAARWYLVNRGPDQTIEIDVDLAAEKTQKNPVYYVQYAHARIAGILRNAAEAEVGAPPPGPLAAEERELIKRLAEFPAIVARRPSGAAPQASRPTRSASPTTSTASTTSTVCSASERRRSGSRSVRATQAVIARCLDLRRCRGARADVSED